MTEDKRAPSTLRPLDRSQQHVAPSDMTESQETDAQPVASQPAAATPTRIDSGRSVTGDTDDTRSPPLIRDVINDAFQDSSAKSQIDPELIKLLTDSVTEQVMKNLVQQQAAGTNPLTSTQQSSPILPFPASFSPSKSTFHQHTPPTPDQRSESWNNDPPSPELATSDTGSQFSHHNSGASYSPRLAKSVTQVQPSSDAEIPIQPEDPSLQSRSSGRRQSRVDGKLSGVEQVDYLEAETQESPDDGETALERAWQPLFHDGIPTARLGSFLRGLALHLIDENEPKCSLVVTPAKMLRFFNETRVAEEHYPWHTIYSRLTYPSLSIIYRNLGCQHHLVQRTNQEHPTVPGLTPAGFDHFMTCLIQAHPDVEFERLAKAVKEMPISNADDRKYRFPKQLSRRLLPTESNAQAQQRLVSSMSHEPSVLAELRGSIAMPPPPPPPASASSSQNPLATSFHDRPRQPYAQGPSTSQYVDDEDLAPPNVPLERERKPYTAKEGTGKFYGTEDIRPPLSQYKTEPAGTKAARSNSGLPPQGIFPTTSQPVNIPQRQQHRGSFSQAPPVQGGFNGGVPHPRPTRGRSSPPPRNAYGNSDPSNVGSIPGSQFGSNLHSVQSTPAPVSFSEEAYNRSFNSQARPERPPITIPSNATGNSRGIPIPSRNAPPIGTGNGIPFGSMGGPVGAPPPSTSYTSRRSMPPPPHSAGPERRRSMFSSSSMNKGAGGGDSGSEGSGFHNDNPNGNHPPPPPMQQYGTSSQY